MRPTEYSAAWILVTLASNSAIDQEAAPCPAGRNPILLPSPAAATVRNYPGLHNVVAYHPGLLSGGAPEGDAGMDTLQAMGVKTIISVDGAEPEIAAAKARGMRYIHLPIGYNGFDDQRKLQLVRATRDAIRRGPVYMHCHHGKHRSAGAAATVAVSLGWASPEAMVARMVVSGTSANYKGLYTCARGATVLETATVDSTADDFPEIWKPTGFVKGMIEIDEVFDRLRGIERAGWATPAEHPDLVPAAEAGRLADLFRVLTDADYVAAKPAEFGHWMRENQARAQSLEDTLAAASDGAVRNRASVDRLSTQLRRVADSCRKCHAAYRD